MSVKKMFSELKQTVKAKAYKALGLRGSWRPAQMRALSNPSTRREIRADFPSVLAGGIKPEKIMAVIEQELAKEGVRLQDVGRINIAYPHKHPQKFRHYVNSAEGAVRAFKADISPLAPSIDWVTADSLCETVQLNRSENQSSLHALTGRQIYDLYMPAQKDPFPFVDSAHDRKEYFVIVDWTVAQGTTIANLMSYIEHNDGKVLAAIGGYMTEPLAQKTNLKAEMLRHVRAVDVNFSDRFADAARNTGRLPELALAFFHAAKEEGKNYTPQQALEIFDKRLRLCGNSVFALTDRECTELHATLAKKEKSFSDFLADLRTVAFLHRRGAYSANPSPR